MPTASSTTLWAARNTNRRTAKAGRARKATVFCSRLKDKKANKKQGGKKGGFKGGKAKGGAKGGKSKQNKGSGRGGKR